MRASEAKQLRNREPNLACKVKQKTGLTLIDPCGSLGCGRFGGTYATDDPRWIIKLTTDKDEGPMAQKIVEYRAKRGGGTGFGPSKVLPGIVFFKDIFRIKRYTGTYVIIRENVVPLSTRDIEDRFEHYLDPKLRNKEPITSVDVAYRWARKFEEYKHRQKDAIELFDAYAESLKLVHEELPFVADAMAELALNQNIILSDVHIQNIGFSSFEWGKSYRPPGTAVIFDIGMTEVEKTKREIPVLNPLHITQL